MCASVSLAADHATCTCVALAVCVGYVRTDTRPVSFLALFRRHPSPSPSPWNAARSLSLPPRATAPRVRPSSSLARSARDSSSRSPLAAHSPLPPYLSSPSSVSLFPAPVGPSPRSPAGRNYTSVAVARRGEHAYPRAEAGKRIAARWDGGLQGQAADGTGGCVEGSKGWRHYRGTDRGNRARDAKRETEIPRSVAGREGRAVPSEGESDGETDRE